MSKTVTATEAKATILALLDDVAAGEDVVITRHGKVVARLVAAGRGHALRGRYRDLAHSNVADEDLFSTDEEWDVTQ